MKFACYIFIYTFLFFCVTKVATAQNENNEAAQQMPRGQFAFDRANTAYTEKEYDKAIRLYSRARTTGFAPGALYYNLGNAHYRKGDLGNAIAAYLKAQQLIPRNDDVRENLATARSQTEDTIHPAPPPQALRSFLFLYYYFSADELLWLSAFFCAALFLFLILHTLIPRKTLVTFSFIVGLLMAVTTVTGAIKTYYYVTPTAAVVTVPKATVRAGPGEIYSETFILHNGTEAQVDDVEGEWVKIDVTRRKGWIPRTSVTLL